MKPLLSSFWRWYNRNYLLNLSIAFFLFSLQIIHLYWLATDIILKKLIGFSLFTPTEFFQIGLILVDYTEIPALFSVSLIYLNSIRKKFNLKDLLYLFMILSQFLHIFWITDEFVLEAFLNTQKTTILPFWLSILAILIDYLELPVIYDTLKKLVRAIKERKDLDEIGKVFR